MVSLVRTRIKDGLYCVKQGFNLVTVVLADSKPSKFLTAMTGLTTRVLIIIIGGVVACTIIIVGVVTFDE